MHFDAENFIKKYNLLPHPEGGYYREIYRADEKIAGSILPERYENKPHTFSTSIYFLLEGSQISKLHRLKSNEQWHYYSGSGAVIYIIEENGQLSQRVLGNDFHSGEEFQVMIKHNSWFCAEVKDKGSYLLAGCTVAPGFEFSDFELGERDMLIKRFPEHKTLILKFT